MKFLFVSLFTLFILAFNVAKAQTNETVDITVKFPDLENEGGKIFAQLISAADTLYTSKVIPVKREFAQVTFHQIPKGKYAVKAFHDVNSNQKMDLNLLGIPKEPFGYSNNVRDGIKTPQLEEQLFNVQGNTVISIYLQ
tara:strand:+ start:2793 stop:3209 length:417 start_codon:yes stop_codon:yes gene_type:complete